MNEQPYTTTMNYPSGYSTIMVPNYQYQPMSSEFNRRISTPNTQISTTMPQLPSIPILLQEEAEALMRSQSENISIGSGLTWHNPDVYPTIAISTAPNTYENVSIQTAPTISGNPKIRPHPPPRSERASKVQKITPVNPPMPAQPTEDYSSYDAVNPNFLDRTSSKNSGFYRFYFPAINKQRNLSNKKLLCAFCGTTSTTQWRRGPKGKHTLCNSCGLKYSKSQKKSKLSQSEVKEEKGPTPKFPDSDLPGTN